MEAPKTGLQLFGHLEVGYKKPTNYMLSVWKRAVNEFHYKLTIFLAFIASKIHQMGSDAHFVWFGSMLSEAEGSNAVASWNTGQVARCCGETALALISLVTSVSAHTSK